MAEVGRGRGGGLQEGGEKDSSMGVPVKWVKQQLPGSERVYQVGMSRELNSGGVFVP